MAPSPAAVDPILLSRCPHCAATFAVPAERMGEAGVRIHCPSCERVYELRRRPGPVGSGVASDPLAGAPAEVVARIVVEELGDEKAREMVAADGEAALFARHGAELLDAFDRYRARAGPHAPAGAFRDALRHRYGIELPAWEADE